MTSKWNGNEPFDQDRPDHQYPETEYEYVDAEPLEAELVEDDYGYEQEAVEEYRGAHRRRDDVDDYEDYDDAAYAAPAAGAGGGAAAGEGAAAGSTAVASGGVPKRGLAMILIAVAALLLLWGIWAMMQDDNAGDTGGSQDAAPASSAPADPQGQNTQQDPNAPAGQQEGQPADPNAPQDPNAPADPANPADGDAEANRDNPAPAPAPAPGEALTAGNAQVYVYNNSGVPDLAGTTATRLQGQFNVVNEANDGSMNMPEQVYGIFPETMVFFDPAVPGADQVAADIAGRVGGTPRAIGDIPEGATGLPDEATRTRGAITVVMAG